MIVRNVLINLFGQGVPLLVALFAIPILTGSLGTDRFGILTLAWVIVGYFSLFDLGIGRALTKLVAENLGKNNTQDVPSLIWTSLSLMAGLGILGAVILIFFTPWLVDPILAIPLTLREETRISFYLLAISIPLVIVSTGLCGVLEAHQRFDLVNYVRIPMGAFTFLGPVVVLPYTKSLVALVSALVAGRIIVGLAYVVLCLRVVPQLRLGICISRKMIKPLLSFGGWLTISNIIGPFMLYADRFFIASSVSVTAVAFYTMPFEVVTKLLVVPSAILGVMFPAFSHSFAKRTLEPKILYRQAIKYIIFIMFPIMLLVIVFSKEGLSLWLNAEYAQNCYRVSQLLAIGVFMNSMGLISQGLIQAAGRPDITAKLHLVEFPLYVGYLLFFLKYGINGAAIAWLIRVSISALALAIIANKILNQKTNNEALACN